MEAYKDTTLRPKERAQDLLSRMSLAEKMAQIRCISPWGQPEKDTDPHIKGRGMGQVSILAIQLMECPLEDQVSWLTDIQTKILEESPHRIPAAFHMEGLAGSYFTGSLDYPSGVNRGATFDPDLERELAESIARVELAGGITQVLAPVLDVSRDPRMGRCGESYGEDPTLAAAMGTAYAQGIQGVEEGGRKASATAKHFMGFHSSRGGIHGAGSSIGERELNEVYGKPFQAAIAEAGLKGIMPCYNVMDGVPFSASHHYLTTILRDHMGFDGVTVSDYSAVSQVYDVKRVGECYADAGALCLAAGMDVELPAAVGYNEELERRFADGEMDMAILDTAVLRVLTDKFRTGLYDHPFADLEALRAAIAAEKAADGARRAARESLVLLKNDGTLPLTSGSDPEKDAPDHNDSKAGRTGLRTAAGHPIRRIAIIGPHAANARFYFGDYTHLSMLESTRAARNTLAGVASDDNSQGIKLIPGTQVQSDEGSYFDAVLDWIAPGTPSLVEALTEALPQTEIVWAKGYPIAGDSEADYAKALEIAAGADLILLTLGGKFGTGSIATMGEGIDATDINLPACQDAFIRKAAELHIPMVGVHFGGRPVSSDAADYCLSALLEAFCPGPFAAEVITDLLLGCAEPMGRLPVSVAVNAGQIPVVYSHENGSSWHQAPSIGFPDYVDASHHPRYSFGHGLSYTQFEYEDLTVDKESAGPEETITITCTVRNAGARAGSEVVQLYLADEAASVARPNMELVGFARAALLPGERARVSFALKPSQLAFLDMDMRWKVEKGKVRVLVGAAADDIRLEGEYTVTEDTWIEGRTRAFWAEAHCAKC